MLIVSVLGRPDGVKTRDWQGAAARAQAAPSIRDEQKPKKPPLELEIHETVDIEGVYRRQLISYNVEQDERAHAYLGIPLKPHGAAAGDAPDKFPAIVALHGTTAQGKEQTAGLSGNPDKAWLDQLCRRGYVVIAPDHFVAGHRIPPEGAYDTARFYQKHPEWTAVGKFTYEHAIAIDLLQSLPEVDPDRIGTLGHSLGGHGAYYLAAYDERVKAAVCNCGGAFFRHNPDVLNSARDRWYVYFKHLRPGLLEGRLPPIDRHEIIALVAPRPFMDLSGLNDGNGLVQRQRVLALLRIMDVYELEKAPQNFAFYVTAGGTASPTSPRRSSAGWTSTETALGHANPPAQRDRRHDDPVRTPA